MEEDQQQEVFPFVRAPFMFTFVPVKGSSERKSWQSQHG